MSSGIVIAFVGSTLPILVPLIQSVGEVQFLPAYVMLILVSGFTGVMLSPMHLCLLLSNEYFGVSMGSVYRHLWLPCVSLIAAGMAYFWIQACRSISFKNSQTNACARSTMLGSRFSATSVGRCHSVGFPSTPRLTSVRTLNLYLEPMLPSV